MATYGDHLAYDKVLVRRALSDGIKASQLSVGLGSISAHDTKRYGWNASDLEEFIGFVVAQKITKLGVWRSDIDFSSKTSPFFLSALGAFLQGGKLTTHFRSVEMGGLGQKRSA